MKQCFAEVGLFMRNMRNADKNIKNTERKMKDKGIEQDVFENDDDFVQFSRDFIRKHKPFLIDFVQMDDIDKRKVRVFLEMIDKGEVEVEGVVRH